ncbi:glutamate--tRNA ligase, partial [bacterium]|nr:glutamate--tRNA ligase [bacterium]
YEHLQWLGITWDEEPVFQSHNASNHIENVHRLLNEKKAYYCYCSPEELAQMRKESEKQGKPFKYPRKCLNLSEERKTEFSSKNTPKAVRFLIPEGSTEYNDLIHGTITVNNSEIDDFIILRSDNTPTYQAAVVSDDCSMNITHVLRGDDHLSNTPKQILLYKALNFPIPHFGHVPLIVGINKKKLSKRYGPVSVKEYKDNGILPEALFNFLVLLGWAPGNDQEFFSDSQLLELFSLEGISKTNAVFDIKKLEWMNGKYISTKNDDELLPLITPLWIKYHMISERDVSEKRTYLLKVINLLKSRVRKLTEFAEYGNYFFIDPSHFDESAQKKYWKETAKERLKELSGVLESITDFNEDTTEPALRKLAESKSIGAGKYIHPARLALTGFGVSPGLFEVMVLLGKETVLRRIKNAVEYLNKFQQ